MLGEMTDADKIMNPQRFGTDPMDIRIQINPKVRIRIPDHFCFKFWCWQRFVLSDCSYSVCFCFLCCWHCCRLPRALLFIYLWCLYHACV